MFLYAFLHFSAFSVTEKPFFVTKIPISAAEMQQDKIRQDKNRLYISNSYYS